MTDRELLERCREHLERIVGRYVLPNSGDRRLLMDVNAHLETTKARHPTPDEQRNHELTRRIEASVARMRKEAQRTC